MEIIFQPKEYAALTGLPFLQQLLYLKAIRPYVDYKTAIVGIKRGVSYQSFAEELYVEPHSGIQSGSPSRDQLRRALQGLARAGLIKLLSKERKLVLECCFIKQHKFNQNQPAINPPKDPARINSAKSTVFIDGLDIDNGEATLTNPREPATPLKYKIKNNNKAQIRTTAIDDDFVPSSTIMDKARSYDLDKAGDQTDLLKFITHNKTRGNVSADWNESYLGWLIKGRELQRQHRKGGDTHVQQHTHTRTNTLKRSHSAVDQVREAYRDVFSRALPTEKVID